MAHESTNGKQYQYEARDDRGELVSGAIAAGSRESAGDLLSKQGLFVVRLTEGRRSASAGGKLPLSAGRATKAQIAWEMWQLASLVEAGIGLSECLDCLARQASQPRVQLLLEDIAKQVREGKPFSDAMESHSESFPESLIATIRASELSGSLSVALRQSSEYLNKDIKIARKFKTALAYPIFMLTMCMAVSVFLITFVLPKFAAVFATRGATLPLPTRALLAISEMILGSWPICLGVVAAIVGGVFIFLKLESGRRIVHRTLITAPLLAPVTNALYQSRSFRTLSMLINAQAPLIDSIQIVKRIVPNDNYRELWSEIEEQAQVGERFAVPLFESEFIDESIAQMIDNGDQAGQLGASFARVADFMEERYERSIALMTQYIEPIMILLMGGIIAFVALSMMLPLFGAARVMAG